MEHKIFVYGTLRPGKGPSVLIPGLMFDLGWFPGVVNIGSADMPDGSRVEDTFFKAEVITVDDDGLERLDRYEGYDERNPDHSLYLRLRYKDGFIYQYNGSVEGKMPVPASLNGGSDWLEYTQTRKGCNASFNRAG